MLRIKKILKAHLPKNKRKFSCLLPLLVSSTFMTSAYGMDGEEDRRTLYWRTVFCAPCEGGFLGPKILSLLDDRSLARSTQVSHGWKALVNKTHDAKHALRCKGKEPLFAAILDAVGAEPDEATRAWHTLNTLMECEAFQGQATHSVKQKLMKIRPRLLQPEALIVEDKVNDFLECKQPDGGHPALTALVQVIEDLEDLEQDPQFKQLKPENAHVFFTVKFHYEQYLKNLLDPNVKKARLRQPKVILSSEGLMGLQPGMNPHGMCSYRISQEMALSLLSKDRYGLFLKSNTSGSHAVKRQGQVHFKGNTTTTGLPVGMESAAYWFSQILFGQGMAPSALLSLNEVEIKTPAQGTQARADYAAALTYSLQLLSKNPSPEELDKIQPGKLALFCSENKLYCKISNKEKIEITKFINSNVGLSPEIFDRILKNICEGEDLTSSDKNALFHYALSQNYIKDPNVDSDYFFQHHPQHQKAFTEQNPHHVLQANLHVEGVPLDDFMKGVEAGQYDYKDLDLSSFSELVFISLLTNPSDGTPGNFMVRTDQGKPYSIVGIDNDMAFGPSIIATKVGKDKEKKDIFKPSLEVKNVLYCLPLMDRPLSTEARDKILSTSPELFLLRWLERLKMQQFFYDKLKDTGYAKDNKEIPHVKEAVYTEELQLPLQLPCGLIGSLLKDFTKLQGKIKSRSAMTHNQLLSFFQPLAHRFYEALKHQYSTPLMAYQYIHNSHHEEIYLEDVLAPRAHEVLTTGQTIGQALCEVLPQDQAPKLSLDDGAQQIWKTLDLNTQQRVSPFLELAATTFASCFQDKTTFHPSWLQDHLLFRALEEGASYEVLGFLLKTLKLNTGLRESQTQQTALHYAIKQKYPQDILQLLLQSLVSEEQLKVLNALDHQGLTPLDHAMEQDEGTSFLTLEALGATTCNAKIALKFYKRKVRETPSLHAAFTKLMNLNPEVEWLVSLEELLPPLVSRTSYRGTLLTSSTYGERQLPKSIKRQIMGSQGEVIRVSNTANHPVAFAQQQGPLKTHGLYFKLYPALPGLEEAVGRLTRQLFGFGAPFTDLVKLGEGQDAVPCLISQAIPGDTLLKVLKTNPKLLDDLDEEDLSSLLIAAMLTNPEDGKPDNYIITLHPTKLDKYRIIGVDNDQAFVPAIVKEKPDTTWTGKLIPVAQVKTILYCLNQMKSPIHPHIRTTIINTHPDLCLETWLKRLIEVNGQQSGLFTPTQQNEFFKKHKSFIGVPFQNGAVKHIYEKFVLLRDLVAEDPEITHIKLLNKLEARLAKRYQEALNKDISVEARFREVDRPFYEVKVDNQKGESHTTTTQSGDVLQSMGIPLKEEIFEAIRLEKQNCPLSALIELETIKKEKVEATLESLAARVGDINLLKTLTLEKSRVLFLKELENQKKILSPQEQTAILDHLAQQKGIRELPLPNFSVMDDELFQRISLEHLIKVDLRQCSHPNFTNDSLILLSQRALGLEELNLSYIVQLKEIGDISFFGQDQSLIFKELRFLNLSNCIKIKKILLQAQKLHYLNVKSCLQLNDQMVDRVVKESPNLQKFVFKGCPLLGKASLTVLGPPYHDNYWRKFQGIGPIIKILQSKGSKLSFKAQEIDTTPQGLMAFAKALKINGNLASLTELYLSGNKIGDAGAKDLANGNLASLTELYLSGNKIGDAGAKDLANGNLRALTSLDLMENHIGDQGARGLGCGNLRALTWLNLKSNNIEGEGAKGLGCGNLRALTSLDLRDNKIGPEGAKGLAHGNLARLTWLSLAGNDIGDEGAKGLVQGNLRALTKLDLRSNNIGDAGAKGLAHGNLRALTLLNLAYNNIGHEGNEALRINYPKAISYNTAF